MANLDCFFYAQAPNIFTVITLSTSKGSAFGLHLIYDEFRQFFFRIILPSKNNSIPKLRADNEPLAN